MNGLFDSLSMEFTGSATHTRLYHLVPLGTGTPMVESLTGYISRLAAAHVVSAGALLTEEILPRIPKGVPVGGKSRKSTDTCQLGLNGPHTINGLTERAEHWVRVLQHLTGADNLQSLTMLPLKGICSSQSLLRRNRAWCPRCYAERTQLGEETNEPLLWAINAVEVCADHRCPLRTVCSGCEQRQPVLAGRSRPRHCWRCRKSLDSDGPAECGLDKYPVVQRELWIAENVGSLLAKYSRGYQPMRACFQENLKSCVSELADGNRSQLLRAAEVKEKTFDAWLSGTSMPELSNLLSFCHQLRIPILRFLAEILREGDGDWERARGIVSEHGTGTRRRRRADVRQVLERALMSPECRSLAEIAADLGYKNINSLRQHDRDACSVISKGQCGPQTKTPTELVEQMAVNQKIRERLEAALNENPPPSVRSLAIELGFSEASSLHCRFQKLCEELVRAYERYRAEQRIRIEACLRAALTENPAPTLKMIAARLHRKDIQSLRRWFPAICRRLKERWREARDARIRAAGAALEAALEEDPVASGDFVARRCGISPPYLASLFPAAWRNLNARFIAARKQKFAEKCEALRSEVRRIAGELCQRGIYPAQRLVKSLIVASEYRSDDVIDSEIQRVMAELGVTGLAHQNPHRSTPHIID